MQPRSLILSALLLLLLPSFSVQAQQWTGTLKVGAVASTLSGDTDTSFDPRVGWAGGGGLGYDFGTGLIIMPELLYALQGAHADDQVGEVPVRVRLTVSYAQIPLLIMYRFQGRRPIYPKIFAGPMWSYKLDARERIRARDGEINQENASIQSTDYGVVAGAGVETDWDVQRLTFEVRGFWGLSNVREAEPALHNRGLAFLFGLTF